MGIYLKSYYIIKLLRLNLLGDIDDKGADSSARSSRALDFIEALGGRENIISTSACITRLRMEVKSSKDLDENLFKKLGAKGVIKPRIELFRL